MKKILALALPLIVSQMISVALVMTDVWMMSHLSVAALAAGGLGASVYSIVFIMAGSTVGCVANLISIAWGQRIARPDFGDQQIRYAVKGGVLLSLMMTVVLTFSFMFAPKLLLLADQPLQVVDLSMEYLSTLKWAMLPSLVLLVLRGLTSAFGHVRSIMVMSLATVVLNVPISYLLAFVFDFGLSGLGAGTALSALLVALGYGLWVFRQPLYARYAPWQERGEYSFSLLSPLLALGIPITLAALLEHGLVYGGTLMAGTVSVAALALHQILMMCLSFAWNVNFGFAQAGAILTGQAFGAGNYAAIRRVALRSFVLTTILSAVMGGVLVLWPEFVAVVFNLDGALTAAMVSIIWIVALAFIADAWQLLAINLLRGMKIVKGPTIATVVGYWIIGLPAAWFLMQEFGLGGIWAGTGIGLGATGVLLLIQVLRAVRSEKGADSEELAVQ